MGLGNDIKNAYTVLIHPIKNFKKLRDYDRLLDYSTDQFVGKAELFIKNNGLLNDLSDQVTQNSELKTQIQESSDAIAAYVVQMEQCEKIGDENLKLEKLVKSHDGLIAYQKLRIREYGLQTRALKKVIADRTQLTESYGRFASFFHSKKRDERKEKERTKIFVKLIGKGLGMEEIDEIIEERGYNGLGEKYLDLVRQKRTERGKKPEFISFGKISKKEIKIMQAETKEREEKDYSEKKKLIGKIIGSVIDSKRG